MVTFDVHSSLAIVWFTSHKKVSIHMKFYDVKKIISGSSCRAVILVVAVDDCFWPG